MYASPCLAPVSFFKFYFISPVHEIHLQGTVMAKVAAELHRCIFDQKQEEERVLMSQRTSFLLGTDWSQDLHPVLYTDLTAGS